MSSVLWLLLFFRKYICLFSLKSVILGLCLLSCSFSVRLLISTHCLRWYGLIFFLVYVGGLLVLFIYVSSLNFNPAFIYSERRYLKNIFVKGKLFFLILFGILNVNWGFCTTSWGGLDQKKYRLNLFKESELFFLVNIGVLLLIVLWIITKLTFRRRGALRPYYS